MLKYIFLYVCLVKDHMCCYYSIAFQLRILSHAGEIIVYINLECFSFTICFSCEASLSISLYSVMGLYVYCTTSLCVSLSLFLIKKIGEMENWNRIQLCSNTHVIPGINNWVNLLKNQDFF